MDEVISYKTVEKIVDNTGYNSVSMDYKNWSESQFKKFMAEVIYEAINTAFKDTSNKSLQ